MQVLTLLSLLATPGSGSVFDPTTEPVSVPIVLDASLTGKPLQKDVRGLYYRYRKEKAL
jgi:hypothetical protein